jgi:DNA-binding transcriptional LysR family regulator
MKQMELRQLASLEAVLETGSFAAAARKRHVAQPALWAQVKGLERELSIALFERVGRGVQPTAAAKALQDRVRRVLDDVRQLEAAVAEVRSGRALPARIGCAPYGVAHLLTESFLRLQTSHPDLPMPEIVFITSTTGPGALLSGDVDLAILPETEKVPCPGERLYPVWISVLGRRVGGGDFDIRRLDGAAVATLPADTGLGMALRRACDEAKVRPRIVLESRDVPSLQAFADRGLAIAVVVSEALGPAGAKRAARLTSGGRSFDTNLWLRWRSEESLSVAARALRQTLLKVAGKWAGKRRARNSAWST